MIRLLRSIAGTQDSPNPRLKRILYAIGGALSLLSIAFLVLVLTRQADRIRELGYLRPLITPLIFAAIFYGASLFTTAAAWPILVHGSVEHRPKRLLLIGLATQIGKYVPGNIASYLGRAALARSQRVDFRCSASTTFAELGASVFAGTLVGLLSFVLAPQSAIVASEHSVSLQLLAGAVLLTLIWFAWNTGNLKPVAQTTAIFIVSFLLAGISLCVANSAFEQPNSLSLAYAVSAFAFAWVAGFVVVGAPAGLGVREAVLVGLLAPVIGTPQAMMLTVVHRAVTILVDLIVGVAANLLLAKGLKPDD